MKGLASNTVRTVEKGTGFPSITSNDRLEKFKLAGFFIYLAGVLGFGVALVVIIAKN